MGNVISRVVLIAFAVVGLFTAGLLGTLGARGKLNRESLAELAGVKEGESGKVTDAPSAAEATPEGAPQGKDAAHAARADRTLASAGLDRIELPSPFSTEDATELFDELKATRSELRNQLIAAKQKESDLELVRSDLNRRWDELDRREQELEEQKKAIDADRVELQDKSLIIKEAEDANLKDLAKKFEKMKAQAAAAALEDKRDSAGEPDAAYAAKILSNMGDRESGKVMENLKPEFLTKVLEKAINLIRPKLRGDSSKPDGASEYPGQGNP